MMSAMPSKPTLGAILAVLAVALIAPTVAVRVQDKVADQSDEILSKVSKDRAASQAADTAG
jgi:hypothetical protein